MPNTFNLSKNESAYIHARPEERKRVSVSPGSDAHIRTDKGYDEFDSTTEIDSPITVVGPGHFSVEGVDTEPSSPAQKVLSHDDVQEPSSAAVSPSSTVNDKASRPKKAAKSK